MCCDVRVQKYAICQQPRGGLACIRHLTNISKQTLAIVLVTQEYHQQIKACDEMNMATILKARTHSIALADELCGDLGANESRC